MKYIVTHKCGHEVEVELYGKGTERQRKIARMEADECPECRAKHAIERDLAKGYSALKGSPKQIAWASDIREGMFDRMARTIREQVMVEFANAEAQGFTPEEIAQATINADTAILEVYNGLRHETSAKWLIEHQSAGFMDELADRYCA